MNETKNTPEMVKMTVTAKISSKGQITVPSLVRRTLGVKEGDNVRFEIDSDGKVSVVGVQEHDIYSIIGILPFDHVVPDIHTLRAQAAEDLSQMHLERLLNHDGQ